jgi:hypothetical protein
MGQSDRASGYERKAWTMGPPGHRPKQTESPPQPAGERSDPDSYFEPAPSTGEHSVADSDDEFASTGEHGDPDVEFAPSGEQGDPDSDVEPAPSLPRRASSFMYPSDHESEPDDTDDEESPADDGDGKALIGLPDDSDLNDHLNFGNESGDGELYDDLFASYDRRGREARRLKREKKRGSEKKRRVDGQRQGQVEPETHESSGGGFDESKVLTWKELHEKEDEEDEKKWWEAQREVYDWYRNAALNVYSSPSASDEPMPQAGPSATSADEDSDTDMNPEEKFAIVREHLRKTGQ